MCIEITFQDHQPCMCHTRSQNSAILIVKVGCTEPTPVHGSNPWPDQLAGFKQRLQDYFDCCLHLGQILMQGNGISKDVLVLCYSLQQNFVQGIYVLAAQQCKFCFPFFKEQRMLIGAVCGVNYISRQKPTFTWSSWHVWRKCGKFWRTPCHAHT